MAKISHLSPIALQIREDSNENVVREQLPPSPPSSPALPLPLPLPKCQSSGKPKRKPTVTPRTFTRFFTPRSSHEKKFKIGKSRQILRDITATGPNRPIPTNNKGNSPGFNEATNEPAISRKRKLAQLASPVTNPDLSSPLKKKSNVSTDISPNSEIRHELLKSEERFSATDSEDHLSSSDSDEQTSLSSRKPAPIKPIIFARPSGLAPLRSTFRRELLGMNSVQGYRCTFHDYRNEVACFYSNPSDAHPYRNSIAKPDGITPFCTTSCNTNSLIAIGDEEGAITLLESAKNKHPGFSQSFLVFNPHENAILDLCFAFDDVRLATAAGDKMSKIIDMYSQKTTHTLNHNASVKQVRFQPMSSNIVATSTRNGNVNIWDLRCKSSDPSIHNINVSLNPTSSGGATESAGDCEPVRPRPVHSIYDAHGFKTGAGIKGSTDPESRLKRAKSGSQPSDERGRVSVTSFAFLNAGRENLFVTGSERNASVKLWDLRQMRSHRRHGGTPLSITTEPEGHTTNRPCGLTSLALSGDGQRLYTLCRDSTVYTYATSHLLNGHAPELSSANSQPRKSAASNQSVLGPLYGFAHPAFEASTFFVKLAVRPATATHSEILAVGSSSATPVLFPTDERYFHFGPLGSRPAPSPLLQTPGQQAEIPPRKAPRRPDHIPIYRNGVPLQGHKKGEVTAVTWTPAGDLVSISDDASARCWRQGVEGEARSLRNLGGNDPETYRSGWAIPDEGWDIEDE